MRLAYADHGAGEPILCLHGYGDSSFSFSPLVPLPPGLRLIALDQRGHGDSERPDGGYAIEDFAADAAAALDALGISRAVVFGHSMGSLVAQRLAIDHPDRVARLVLIGSTTNLVSDAVRELCEEVEQLDDPVPHAAGASGRGGARSRRVPRPRRRRCLIGPTRRHRSTARLLATVDCVRLNRSGTPSRDR